MTITRTENQAMAIVCIGFALAVAIRVQAQTSTNASDASMMDKHFVSEALKGGMAEVELGKLAQEKASSDDVKAFGKKMVEDHSKLGDQMKEVATQVGVTPPSSPTIMEQVEIKKLKGLDGNQFDQEYIKAMVKDHQGDLKDFKKEAENGKSPVVKEAANHGADVVSGHLSMIQEIARAHKVAVN